MSRDELTAIINRYADDYAKYKLDTMQQDTTVRHQAKPPVNPVLIIMEAFRINQQ